MHSARMKEGKVYRLRNDNGIVLIYNPAERLIFFESGYPGTMLSEALGIETSHTKTPSPSKCFEIEQMRAHYKERLREGFRVHGGPESFDLGQPRAPRPLDPPSDFEYGLTDT
jgi:hypothetical protein